MEQSDTLDALRTFRHSLYECFERRADALFELTDSILTAGVVPSSPVHLSLQPSHRRGWGSLYAALERGQINVETLQKLLACHPIVAGGENRPSMRGTSQSGPAAMRSVALSGVSTTIPLATRRGSPSSPGGPTSSLHS